MPAEAPLNQKNLEIATNPAVPPEADERTRSYRQIFKSTSLVGGAQVANILIGIARTKALAVLLGPAGMGLAGMYQSATGLVGTLTGFGIGQAGVRQIAEAEGTGDKEKIARTIHTLRRTALFSGILGTLIVLVFYRPITRATFGNLDYAAGVALVSLTLLFGGISAGQTALLQGLRHLKELAACTVLGSLFGTLVSIAIVYYLGEKGVALFLVAVAALGVITSWWFARRIQVKSVMLTFQQMSGEIRGLLRMGLAFAVSGLLSAGTAYIVRILIIRELGMVAVGLYTATWTLSTLYVGVILNAMAADFYPRLTAVAEDNTVVNRMVNEQTEMGLLMAIPGIIATLALAPLVLQFFYSAAFLPATGIIRWQILGIALRVVSWPVGFILLAKGRSRLFMLSEVSASVLQIVFTILCLRVWGLEGIGMAFFFLYVAYTILMLFIVNRISGFFWTRQSLQFISFAGVLCILIFIISRSLPSSVAFVLSISIAIMVTVICVYMLKKLLNVNLMEKVQQHFWGNRL